MLAPICLISYNIELSVSPLKKHKRNKQNHFWNNENRPNEFPHITSTEQQLTPYT